MQLKDALKLKGKIIIGENRTMKSMRDGKLKEVFVSSNFPKEKSEKLSEKAKAWGFEVNRLKINSEELGARCRKPFAVAVIGITK